MPKAKVHKTEVAVTTNYGYIAALNKIRIGESIRAIHIVHELDYDKDGVLLEERRMDDIDQGFEIRRILGGFMYKYDGGGAAFVSNDELRNE